MRRGFIRAKDPVIALRVIRISRTLPVSIVVEGDDGELYHVPLTQQNGQRDVSADTWVCGIAAVAVGLPINPQRMVVIPSRILREFPPHALPGQEEMAVGHATTVLADLMVGPRGGPLRTFSFLPQCNVKYVKNKQDFIGMYLFDLWVERGRARKVLFNRTDRSREIRASFVNDGSVLAGQHCSRQAILNSLCRQPHSLYEGGWSQTQAESWLNLFRRAMPGALTSAVSSMPTIWRAHGNHSTLCQQLIERLELLETLATACALPDAAFWNTDPCTSRVGSASVNAIA